MTAKEPNLKMENKSNFKNEENLEIDPTNKYGSLTSKLINDRSTTPYFEALDFAFSQSDVKNIAITGPYGAGKSTVIESYLTLHKNEPFVNVSLAGFDISGLKSSPDVRDVELSILQQILYKVDRDTVPDSRIDRIQDRNDKHVLQLFLSLAKIIIPFLILISLTLTNASGQFFLVPMSIEDLFKEHYLIRIFSIISLALTTLYFLTQAASKAGIFDKKLKLSKIAFLSGDAEIQEQESVPSLLNTCIDEIVYFFSRSKYKIVVFEDLDRLSTPEIFIKLREINKIINNKSTNEDPVRFIYAVKDDIFLGIDVRTKFFDFIVPIVPIMDNRNAYSILKSKMLFFPEKDYQCLRGASLYITELRSLQNIINEYNLFMNIVDNQSNKAKLFALIFYKNLYTLDYNLADKKLGILYSYMRDFRTKSLHHNYFGDLDSHLIELENILKIALNEKKSSSKDIREEILSRLIPKHFRTEYLFYREKQNGYHVSYSNFDVNTLIENEDKFIDFLSYDLETYIGRHREETKYKLEKNQILEFSKEYQERSNTIKDEKEKSIIEIKKNINEVKIKIQKRNEINLSDLTKINGQDFFKKLATSYINNIEDENVLSKAQVKTVLDSLKYGGFEALYYLISNNYLMQDFMMYRSIFHKGSISDEDNEYIKKVGIYIDHREANDKFIIENVADVTRELEENYYIHRDGALHHQVISYLLNNNKKLLTDIINSLFNKSLNDIYSIIKTLYDKFDNQLDFDKLILFSTKNIDNQNKIIAILLETDTFNEPFSKKIIISLMSNSDLEKSDRKIDLKDLVEKYGWNLISEIEPKKLNNFMECAKTIGVTYDNIFITNEIEKVAVVFLADNNMYKINQANFCNIVLSKIQNEQLNSDIIESKPWETLSKFKLKTIEKYIKLNINTFIKELFLSSKESLESIIHMLNNNDVDINLKEKIISHMSFKIDDHSKIENKSIETEENRLTLHDMLYVHDKITPNWTDLTKYIKSECNRAILRNYIELNAAILSELKPTSEISEEFYLKIICDDELSEDAYLKIITPLEINYDIFDENISTTCLTRLINKSKLSLNESSFNHILYMKEHSQEINELLLVWFKNHQDEFTSNMQFYMMKNEDMIFFEKLLIDSITKNIFSDELKSIIITEFTSDLKSGLLKSIKLTLSIIKLSIQSSDDEDFKLELIEHYVTNEKSKKSELISLTASLSEPQLEIRKIFMQRTQATLNISITKPIQDLLVALKNKKYISEFSNLENRKIVVKIESSSHIQDWEYR